MAKWSGRGIPPTRKKLHNYRLRNAKSQQHVRLMQQRAAVRRARSWMSNYEGAEELISFWCPDD